MLKYIPHLDKKKDNNTLVGQIKKSNLEPFQKILLKILDSEEVLQELLKYIPHLDKVENNNTLIRPITKEEGGGGLLHEPQ
jgi:hypothetical protein